MDSFIQHTAGGILFSGPDAIRLQQAITLRSAIKMYVRSGGQIIPTRGMGITKMLKHFDPGMPQLWYCNSPQRSKY